MALFVAFISTAYILSELTKVFQKKQVVGLIYKESTIKNFIMAGVGEDRFLLKGKEIIDKKSIIKMYDIEFEYKREAAPIFLKSKYANIYIDNKLVELKDKLLIIIGNVNTTGKNLYIDIEKNILKLENVKTVIRGS